MSTIERANVLQKILNALPRPLDIITLIDGSGSVSKSQFTTMSYCMRTLTKVFEFPSPPNDLVRIGAVQFDTEAHLICSLTSDPVVFNTAVATMTQKNGNTNVAAGFLSCLTMFKVDARNAAQVVILFTDGDTAGAKAILPQIVEEGIKVFSFGIGLSESKKSSVVDVSEHVVFVKEFEEMQDIVCHLSVLPSAPPKINIRTKSAKKASFDIIYSEAIQAVELKLLAFGSNQWKILPIANNNTYFLDGLAHDTEYKVTARVQTLSNAWTSDSEPQAFRTLREIPETATLKSPQLECINDKIIEDINKLTIPEDWQQIDIPYVNILLLGNIGHGKSAFFNSVQSTLSGRYTEVQMHKVSTQTVTLTIDKKFLSNKSIRVWDTYGWTSSSSSYEKEFEFLVDGAVPDGYKEADEMLRKLNQNAQIGDKAHAIIVVYEMPAVTTESNMVALQRFYNKMCMKKLQPIIILTKVDLIAEAGLEGSLSDIYDSGVIDVYISEFCKLSTVPRANVFPIVNFRGAWQQRDYVAEKLILNAFNTALSFAYTKVANLVEGRVVVYDKSDPSKSRRVAIVDRGNVDDSVMGLAERISTEPGLEQFQLLNSSSVVVPKSQYPQTKFMACANNSKHGYWEAFGLLPTSTPPAATTNAPVPPIVSSTTLQSPAANTTAPTVTTTTTPTVNTTVTDSEADNEREIGIFTVDPQIASDHSAGSVLISPNATLAQLRAAVVDQVELPKGFDQFQFVRLEASTGSRLSLVSNHDEPAVKSSSVMVLKGQNAHVRVAKPQAIEIGITLEPNKKVGFIENLSLQSTLDVAKALITEQTDIDFEFRFLTIADNNVSLNQEKSRALQSVMRNGENGELYVVIRKV